MAEQEGLGYQIMTEAEYDLLDEKRMSPAALENLHPAPKGSFNRKAGMFWLAHLIETTEAGPSRKPVLVKRVDLKAAVVPSDAKKAVKDWPGLQNSVGPQRLLREIAIGLQMPKDSHLCPTLGWCTDLNHGDPKLKRDYNVYCILFSYDTDLFTYLCELLMRQELHKRQARLEDFGLLGKDEFGLITKGIAKGICLLHEGFKNGVPIVHRDVKLGNVFLSLSRDGNSTSGVPFMNVAIAAVGDFGITRREGGNPTSTNTGTPGFAAPELFLQDPSIPEDRMITPKADTFSFGVALWLMLHFPRWPSSPPAPEERIPPVERQKQLSSIQTKYYPLECDPGTPPALKVLIQRCTQYHAADRPTMEEVQNGLTEIFPNKSDSPRVMSVHPTPLSALVGRIRPPKEAVTTGDAAAEVHHEGPALPPQDSRQGNYIGGHAPQNTGEVSSESLK